jgi:hypothetical protein
MGRLGTLDEKLPRVILRMISTRIGDEHHFVIRFEREVVTNRGRVEEAIGAALVEERHAKASNGESSNGESFGRIAVENLGPG